MLPSIVSRRPNGSVRIRERSGLSRLPFWTALRARNVMAQALQVLARYGCSSSLRSTSYASAICNGTKDSHSNSYIRMAKRCKCFYERSCFQLAQAPQPHFARHKRSAHQASDQAVSHPIIHSTSNIRTATRPMAWLCSSKSAKHSLVTVKTITSHCVPSSRDSDATNGLAMLISSDVLTLRSPSDDTPCAHCWPLQDTQCLRRIALEGPSFPSRHVPPYNAIGSLFSHTPLQQ